MAKKEKSEVRKIGIYMPIDRVSEVEEFRDRMNFSELFWSAFDLEKHRLKCLPTGEAMSKFIERLRKSKSNMEEQQKKEGLEAGSAWAQQHAEYSELVALRELSEQCESAGVEMTDDDVQRLFNDDYSNFWEESGVAEGHRTIGNAFVEGFVQGAIDALAQAEEAGI